MDRQNFYFGKLVDVPEMHDLQNNIENGINVIKTILGKGIWKGGAITISQNLNLSIEDTVCFDNNGNTIFIGNQILDLSSLVPPIDKKIVSITASFSRNYSQAEQDDQGNNVFFKEDEGCLIEYIESDVSTSPIAPTIPESRVLLADVTLTAGQTQINAGDLNLVRVKKLDSLAKKLIDVFSYIDSQIANHDSQHDDRFYLKSEVDTKDTNTLNGAKSYTDGLIANHDSQHDDRFPYIYRGLPPDNDANRCTLMGYYCPIPGGANAPNSDWWGYFNMQGDGSRVQQFAFGLNHNTLYYRTYLYGTWSSWDNVATGASVAAANTNTLNGAKSYTDGQIANHDSQHDDRYYQKSEVAAYVNNSHFGGEYLSTRFLLLSANSGVNIIPSSTNNCIVSIQVTINWNPLFSEYPNLSIMMSPDGNAFYGRYLVREVSNEGGKTFNFCLFVPRGWGFSVGCMHIASAPESLSYCSIYKIGG